MGEVAAAAFGRCQHRWPAIFGGCAVHAANNSKISLKSREWKEGTAMVMKIEMAGRRTERRTTRMIIAAAARSPSKESNTNPHDDIVTFSSNFSIDVPLYEPPGVSFDDYLSDRPRMFRAMFPDQRRSNRLNDEEWRLQMQPINFLLVSASPAVVMRLRCKSHGQGYPPAVPLHVPTILELEATGWELQGLDAASMPSHFGLSVQGVLYSERRRSLPLPRLKCYLEMGVSLARPPFLALVPVDVIRGVAESVLKGLLEKIKQQVHGGLLADFRSFGREKLMNHEVAAAPAPPPASDQIRPQGIEPRLIFRESRSNSI